MRHIQHILRAINMAATSSRTCSDQGYTLSLEDFHEEFSYLFSTLLAVKCIPLHVSYILYALTSRGRLF